MFKNKGIMDFSIAFPSLNYLGHLHTHTATWSKVIIFYWELVFCLQHILTPHTIQVYTPHLLLLYF